MVNNRYGLLFFMLLLVIIQQVDRNIIIGFAPMIIKDLELTNAQFGLLSGAFFSISYAISGLFMGVLADRFNRTKVIAVGLLFWSVFTGASGLARSFIQISIMRAFVGVGEASLIPSATSMLSDNFPPDKRATAIGFFFAGVPLGLGASYVVAGYLGPIYGWRNTFILLGVIGITLTALTLMFKDPKRGGEVEETTSSVNYEPPIPKELPKLLWNTIRGNAALSYALLGIMLAHFFYASQAFSQIWLIEERGFKWEEIVAVYGIIAMVSGALGAMSGGLLSDWYRKRFAGDRAGFICWLVLLLTPLVISYRFIDPSSILFYVATAAGFFMVTAFYGPAFAILQEETPVNIRATIIGVTMMLINVICIGLGSVLIGLAIDVMKEAGVHDPVTMASFAGDILAVLSGLAFYMVVKSQEKASELRQPLQVK